MKQTNATTQQGWQTITDADYIAGLKMGDPKITEAFFNGLCNYTLSDVRLSLMQGAVDYNELVNELYIYLSTNNWHKLDTFLGLDGCALRSWMVRVIWRFFLQQRDRLLGTVTTSVDDIQLPGTTDELNTEIALDVASTFSLMPNKRYVQVLKWMLQDGRDAQEVALLLDMSVANVYNLKHRAIVQFVEIYGSR